MTDRKKVEDYMHHAVGAVNYAMVDAHKTFGHNFNIKLEHDSETGLYLIAVEVEDDTRL
jgi:hypothetical protein